VTVWCNVGCGPYRAPAPWINLDCHEGDNVHPDVLVDAENPLGGFEPGTVERVYLGHVLEHVPWPEVPLFLQQLDDKLTPGGEICVVGPDVYRIIKRWHENLDPEGWPLVESCLENPWGRCYAEEGYAVTEGIEPDSQWKYARHWWNCYETRIVYALEKHTHLVDITPQPITPEALGGWPLTAYTEWQCAVTARAA
jgi:hypothetical protein